MPPPGERFVPEYPAPPGALTLESLRNGLVLIGVLAVAALGLAVWALLRPDSDRGGSSQAVATRAALSNLNGRIDRLNTEIQALQALNARTGNIASLKARVGSLERTMKRVSASVAGAASATQVSQLSRRVDKLSTTVSQLKATQTSTRTTTTVTTTSP